MTQDTATIREMAQNPLTRQDVVRAFELTGNAIDILRGGLVGVPLSEREPCELLAGYAREMLSTTHSILCSALCDVEQDWRK